MAYAYSLRGWGKHDAQRLARAVAWGRYNVDDAQAELATTLAWYAQRAGMRIGCKALAASMLSDELDPLDAHHDAVLQRMTAAAEQVLLSNPRAALAAAVAAADIARAERVPPSLIDTALRFAVWRTKRRA
jgi:hypothetical protein